VIDCESDNSQIFNLQFFFSFQEDGSVENLRSDTSSPLVEDGSSGTEYIPVPPGWREMYDEDSGQPCYVNNATGAKVSCKPLQVAGSWK
jgi:hypothetical protein